MKEFKASFYHCLGCDTLFASVPPLHDDSCCPNCGEHLDTITDYGACVIRTDDDIDDSWKDFA